MEINLEYLSKLSEPDLKKHIAIFLRFNAYRKYNIRTPPKYTKVFSYASGNLKCYVRQNSRDSHPDKKKKYNRKKAKKINLDNQE